jgi:hypothetical protein
VDGATERPERRTATPAVVGAALFAACCAVFAVTFVAGRGGLQMPVAPASQVAEASEEPLETEPPEETDAPEPTLQPPATLGPPSPTVAAPSPPPPTAPPPTAAPPTGPPPSIDPNDPLARLPGCPDHPGCFQYIVQRNDTLTGIVSRYLLSITTVLVLNPDLDDPSVIVTGETLYLGRTPFVRLDSCPNGEACSLYVIVRGDRLAEIAARYGVTVDAIRASNPGMSTPIVTGEVIKLPHPA